MQTSPKRPAKKSTASIKSPANKAQPGSAASSVPGEPSRLPSEGASCETRPPGRALRRDAKRRRACEVASPHAVPLSAPTRTNAPSPRGTEHPRCRWELPRCQQRARAVLAIRRASLGFAGCPLHLPLGAALLFPPAGSRALPVVLLRLWGTRSPTPKLPVRPPL